MDTRQTVRAAGATSVRSMDRRATGRVAGAASVRVAALGGALFFFLVVAFSNLVSGFPTAANSRLETFTYLAAHQDRLQVAAVLMGLAMPAVLLWLSGLFRALRKAEGGTPGLSLAALGGGVLAAAGTVTGALVAGTTANRITDLGPSSARVWWTMVLLSVGGTLLGLLLLIGTTGVVCLQRHLFARWFAVASIVLALVSVVGALTIGYDATGIQVVAGIAVVLDSVWILLVSLFLWRDPELAVP